MVRGERIRWGFTGMMKLAAMVAAGALVAGSAQGACWSKEEATAAGIRQLQSMLMVSALRCQAAGTGIMGDYNAFVTANRQAIAAENDRIRGHFIHALGAIAGQRAYDSFTTSMANGYGAGQGAPATCDDAAALAREAGSMRGSRDGLLLLIDQLGLEAQLPEGRCELAAPVTMASVAPTRVPGLAATQRVAAMAQAPNYAALAQAAPMAPAATLAETAYDPR